MTLSETSFPARDRLNDRMVRQVRYTGPASYATGGEAVNSSADLGMAEVYAVEGCIGNLSGAVSTAIRVPFLDYANQKVQWFVPNTGAEVAGAVDLSTFVGTLTFYGKG
jgi:hypothetical protein